eukprot:sb/3462194/
MSPKTAGSTQTVVNITPKGSNDDITHFSPKDPRAQNFSPGEGRKAPPSVALFRDKEDEEEEGEEDMSPMKSDGTPTKEEPTSDVPDTPRIQRIIKSDPNYINIVDESFFSPQPSSSADEIASEDIISIKSSDLDLILDDQRGRVVPAEISTTPTPQTDNSLVVPAGGAATPSLPIVAPSPPQDPLPDNSGSRQSLHQDKTQDKSGTSLGSHQDKTSLGSHPKWDEVARKARQKLRAKKEDEERLRKEDEKVKKKYGKNWWKKRGDNNTTNQGGNHGNHGNQGGGSSGGKGSESFVKKKEMDDSILDTTQDSSDIPPASSSTSKESNADPLQKPSSEPSTTANQLPPVSRPPVAKGSETLPPPVTKGSETLPQPISKGLETLPQPVTKSSETLPQPVTKGPETLPQPVTKGAETLPPPVAKTTEIPPSRPPKTLPRTKKLLRQKTEQELLLPGNSSGTLPSNAVTSCDTLPSNVVTSCDTLPSNVVTSCDTLPSNVVTSCDTLPSNTGSLPSNTLSSTDHTTPSRDHLGDGSYHSDTLTFVSALQEDHHQHPSPDKATDPLAVPEEGDVVIHQVRSSDVGTPGSSDTHVTQDTPTNDDDIMGQEPGSSDTLPVTPRIPPPSTLSIRGMDDRLDMSANNTLSFVYTTVPPTPFRNSLTVVVGGTSAVMKVCQGAGWCGGVVVAGQGGGTYHTHYSPPSQVAGGTSAVMKVCQGAGECEEEEEGDSATTPVIAADIIGTVSAAPPRPPKVNSPPPVIVSCGGGGGSPHSIASTSTSTTGGGVKRRSTEEGPALMTVSPPKAPRHTM